MSARAFEIMANLAKRRPLRGIQTVCETQHQISTRKLDQYTDAAGDELAGYAFNLRNEFDKIAKERDAALKQVEGLRAALSELLNCPANVVQATVPRAGVEAATPYQVVLDVSVSLTRWRKAQEALSAKP